MTPRTAIAGIAKAIGQELASGPGPGDGAWAAGEMLAEAGATGEIVACLLAEARRKRPEERVVHGCAFLLERALDTLRLRANGGDTGAGRAITELRTGLAAELAKPGAAPEVLLLLARAFAQAGLDPGEALQQAVLRAMEARSAAAMPPGGGRLEEIAAALGDDPFAIHAELAATGAAFPPEHRAAMAAALAASGNAAVREAALGFACAPDPEIGTAALRALAQPPAGHPVPGRLVERLVRLRPWLSEPRRAALDAAVRALRPKAAPPAAPATRPEIRAVLATFCDGAGAQNLFALVRRGQRFALAAVLVKIGIGVADAWVAGGMSRTEAEAMMADIVARIETVEIPIGLLERRLADALATNVARDLPPPFGLLQVAETLGLGPLHPEPVPPGALAEALLAALPAERAGAAATQAAHRASAGWEREFEVLESWFEAGEAVEALLDPLRTRRQRIEAVLTRLLPERRGFWAERCAWMAAVLKEGAEEEDDAWVDFALVARDLAGDRPLESMPFAARIAAATVEAFVRR